MHDWIVKHIPSLLFVFCYRKNSKLSRVVLFSFYYTVFEKNGGFFYFFFSIRKSFFFVRFEMLFHKEKKNRVLVFPLGQVFSQKCSSSALFFQNQIEFLRDMKIFFFIIIF